MNGVFSDIYSQHGPLNLYWETIKLAESGALWHVSTIFFDSEDSWRTWSFRGQADLGSDALNVNNFYENPKRAFNYQRCVSAQGIDMDNDSIVQHYAKPLKPIPKGVVR